MQPKTILIVGMGLLGASLGMALRGYDCRRLGWARRESTRNAALELDVIDESSDEVDALLKRADLTVLAMPIPANIDFLRQHRDQWRPGAVVTDLGSTKSSIISAAAEALAGSGVHFVGSHPMAGTEKSGIGAAFAELYASAEVFVVPGDCPEATARVEKLWRSIGARTVRIGAVEHDDLVAHTSHVPHILASALTLSVLSCADPAERARRFSGCATGFRDTSRIASSNPVMWREIIENNREAVLAAMADFDRFYEEFRKLITAKDFDAFEKDFAAGKALRDEWMAYKYQK